MNMSQNISSGVSKNVFWEIKNNGWMHFYRDILMEHHRLKKRKKLNYCIEEWHTSAPYDIFRNKYSYPTVCLLLDTWHRNYHCIAVCGKWIFDSNLKVSLPLTQDCLNCTCRGYATDENKFVGVLHAIIPVPHEVIQRRLNMK